MRFYTLAESLNNKIIGVYPQIGEAIYNCDVWNDPRFIDRFGISKIEITPKTAKAVLRNKAELTDLLIPSIIGFSLRLLLSGKLRSIIENNRKSGIQFFQSPVVYNNKEIDDYWLLNLFQANMEFIDFNKSDIFLTENTFTLIEKLSINNYADFLEKKKEVELKGYPYGLKIEKIKLIENPNQSFFALLDVEGGVKYVVSENLKNEIEEARCTGIEFMPIELTLYQWLAKGGEREKIYGKA